MKMSELKVGMFCVIRTVCNELAWCVVLPATGKNGAPSVVSIAGDMVWCTASDNSHCNIEIAVVPTYNKDNYEMLSFRSVPSFKYLSDSHFNVVYNMDDNKASKIKARIDTLHFELNQLTEELNSL